MPSTQRHSAATKPYRSLVQSDAYLDSISQQSCLASRVAPRVAQALIDDLAAYTLTEIRRAEQWGQDLILLTTLQNAHIGNSSDAEDPQSPLVYPDGPAMVYRFMRSPDGEIDATWDESGQYHPSTRNIACKPPWSMKDVPDSMVMKAAAKVSTELRDSWKPLVCDGTSLGYINTMIENLANDSHLGQTPKIFLHLMATEVPACREYLKNKANGSNDEDGGTEAEMSHHKLNEFFHVLDIMTLRRADPQTPDRAPLGSICSNAFLSEVIPHYFDRWDQIEVEEQAHVRSSYYQCLLTFDSRYGSIPRVREVVNRAAGQATRAVESSATKIEPYDYVGKYKARMKGGDQTMSKDDDGSERRAMLSRLAGELRKGNASEQPYHEGESELF